MPPSPPVPPPTKLQRQVSAEFMPFDAFGQEREVAPPELIVSSAESDVAQSQQPPAQPAAPVPVPAALPVHPASGKHMRSLNVAIPFQNGAARTVPPTLTTQPAFGAVLPSDPRLSFGNIPAAPVTLPPAPIASQRPSFSPANSFSQADLPELKLASMPSPHPSPSPGKKAPSAPFSSRPVRRAVRKIPKYTADMSDTDIDTVMEDAGDDSSGEYHDECDSDQDDEDDAESSPGDSSPIFSEKRRIVASQPPPPLNLSPASLRQPAQTSPATIPATSTASLQSAHSPSHLVRIQGPSQYLVDPAAVSQRPFAVTPSDLVSADQRCQEFARPRKPKRSAAMPAATGRRSKVARTVSTLSPGQEELSDSDADAVVTTPKRKKGRGRRHVRWAKKEDLIFVGMHDTSIREWKKSDGRARWYDCLCGAFSNPVQLSKLKNHVNSNSKIHRMYCEKNRIKEQTHTA